MGRTSEEGQQDNYFVLLLSLFFARLSTLEFLPERISCETRKAILPKDGRE